MEDKQTTLTNEECQSVDSSALQDRREIAKKLGKFAAYAAPFTVLALTKKANAASAHGPVKHP